MTTTEAIRETLPGAAYHSEETYRIDQERVFYRNWIYVGRAERPARTPWLVSLRPERSLRARLILAFAAIIFLTLLLVAVAEMYARDPQGAARQTWRSRCSLPAPDAST